MAKIKQVARFAIGNERGICSEVWTAWVNGSDFYMTDSSMKGKLKISFHASGVCHYSALPDFFAEHREAYASYNREDRTALRWKRPRTPDHGPLVAASLLFAAYESWEPFWEYADDKPVTLLPPPAHGWGTHVGVLYSREDPDNHCGGAPPTDVYIARFVLANGEFVTLVPGPAPLARDFFDVRLMTHDVPMLSYCDPTESDHRNIAILQPLLLSDDGPLRVHSMHNMRMRTVDKDQFESEQWANQPLATKLRVAVENSLRGKPTRGL